MSKEREKMQEALVNIDEFIEQNGFPPTCRELCDMMNFTSSSTGHKYINLLISEGYLERTGRGGRSLKRIYKNDAVSVKVPVIGVVTAGEPITAIQNISGYISFICSKHHDGELFALKIRGESMVNAGIYDGDIIIAESTPQAENGDIVVALINGENATVKTFYKENGHFRLQPENDSMQPIILNDVSILGKVVGLQREY